MLGGLFNKDKDKDEEEKRQMVEGMQSMSDQILALSKQLADRNAEIERLQKATSGAKSDASALQVAQKQVADLQGQLHELQRKLAEDKATQEANAAVADRIRKQQESARAKATTAAPAAAPAASGGIAVGGTAYVTRAGGMPLRLRSGGGLSHKVVDKLPPGTQMTLLDGPHQADNHAWWHIRTTDGREGWVAGEELRSQPD
jgi:predicted RNase H-like nuclease (RuvC/YqgF family)